MSFSTRLKAIQPIVIVLILAILLRVWAVSLLPEDFDEPVYLQTGIDYANLLRAGDLNAVIDYSGVTEHPAFAKLLYGIGILGLGEQPEWLTAFYLSRSISALFGVLAVAFLAIALDPFAAGMLAVHTLAIKYGSQVYLEAIPHALTIGAILAFLRTDGKRLDRWFWIAAVALGVATASKYSYTPVIVIVLGYIAIVDKKMKWEWLIGFACVSLAAFFAADVSLWHDPIGRLSDSLLFHVNYSQSAHVQESGYPWFQPVIWILTSSPAYWHPEVFFYYGFDAPITILAFLGLRREFKERRWLVVWLAAGLLFLFLWPTKWPQYALIVTPPLCIMAAETLRRAIRWVKETDAYWKYLGGMLPNPGKWFWVILGGFAVFVASIYLSAAIQLASGKVGWSHLTADNSGLPSNTIHDLLVLQDGRVMIATDRGAALWSAPPNADTGPGWAYFDRANQSLENDQVLSLAQDGGGGLWFGTAAGLTHYSGGGWYTYHALELGLNDEAILCLLASEDGRIYAGTLDGASVWNGAHWSPIPPTLGQPVFSIAADGSGIWFGTDTGAGRWKSAQAEWIFFPTESPVRNILPASDGNLWVGTASSGIARLDGTAWSYYRISNAEIPYNNVNQMAEIEPGIFWVATSASTDVGGTVTRFDGLDWHAFRTTNSGASGGEPVDIVRVGSDTVWIGTRTMGIDIYKLGSEK